MNKLENRKTKSWLGPTIGVAGIFIAVFLFLLQSKGPSPSYSVSDIHILASTENADKNLRIFWGDELIPNVYSSNILLWNSGRKHLDFNDIKSFAPPTIFLPLDSKVLSHQIEKMSRDDLKISLIKGNISENQIEVKTNPGDSLEASDGVLISIVFTSLKSPKIEEITVTGGIKGIPTGWKRREYNTEDNILNKIQRFIFLLSCALLGLTFTTILWNFSYFYTLKKEAENTDHAQKIKSNIYSNIRLLQFLALMFFIILITLTLLQTTFIPLKPAL